MFSKQWLVIGISGATCSGKTSLTNRLQKEFENSRVMHQDSYFLPVDDPRHVKIKELGHFNWELISSLDMDKMISDVMKMIEPEEKRDQSPGIFRKNLLILEGFILFRCKAIADLCELKYFITLPNQTCWERRQKRVYEPKDVPGYFEKAVWPEYLKYKDDLTRDEDLCKTITFIDGSKDQDEIYDIVYTEIKRHLARGDA